MTSTSRSTEPFNTTGAAPADGISTKSRLVGRILSVAVVLFLLFDSVIHIANIQMVREAMAELGFAENLNVVIGIVLLACLVLYVLPATSILGAVLLTGYLGGAVATNMLTEQSLFSTILFPIYIGIVAWGGLYLRDAR